MPDYASNLTWVLSLLDAAAAAPLPASDPPGVQALRERLVAADLRIRPVLGQDPQAAQTLAEQSLKLAQAFEHGIHARSRDVAAHAEQLADGWEALGAWAGAGRAAGEPVPKGRGILFPWPDEPRDQQLPPAQDASGPAVPERHGR